MFRREYFSLPKPIAANYDTPSGVLCVQVSVPDDVEHLRILQGLMAMATQPDFWQGSEAEAAQRAYLWEVAYEATTWEDCQVDRLPTIDVYLCNEAVVSGGTLTYTTRAELPFGFTMFSDTTINRYITAQSYWLKAGTYSYSGWYTKNTSSGIVSVSIGNAGGSINVGSGSVDQYAAAFGGRFQLTDSAVVIPDDDFYNFEVRNKGLKNASSTGYSVNWCSHHLRQVS